MATQKRATRGASKKTTVKSATAPKRKSLKAAATGRRKRATPTASATTNTVRAARRSGGVIKRAIKKGISELAKVGS